MARVAFVMDKPLRHIGLSGRSIVPMLIGFGCTVPGVMATRTLPSERDRKMTILLTPFMSCSAKLPIYAFFSAVFFPKHAMWVMAGLYLLGILMGVLHALLMRKTIFSGEPVPFVMELPNYRMPGAKNVCQLLWEKSKDFLQRAFTVIFAATIVVWFLQTFDMRLNVVDRSQGQPARADGGRHRAAVPSARLWRLAHIHRPADRLHGKGKRRFHADHPLWQHGGASFRADAALRPVAAGVLPALYAVHRRRRFHPS